MSSLILSLDLGTTGNRALAISQDGQVVASSYYEFPQIFPQPGWVEHDPEIIWQTTYQAIQDVVNKVGLDAIAAIGITNQRETTVLWDKKSGRPFFNAIVWQCRRTTERCKTLTEYSSLIQDKTGLFLDPYFSATKIEWILNHSLEAKKALSENRLCFGTIDSWIIWKLTDGNSHITDASNASRTLLFNIHTGDYDPELLKLFSLPHTILPTIVDSSGISTHTSKSILGKEIPISGIIGDQQAALFTQCGTSENTIKNTYGTGLFIVANTGTKPLKSKRLISTVAWRKNNTLSYAIEGSVFIGGSAIQWLRDGLGIIQSSSETEALAKSLSDNDDVYFVPALSGLGAPHWDPTARGLFIGLTRGTTKAHMVRSVLESLAYQTRDVFEELPLNTFSCLKVDGGASANSFLMQFQSDILGIPVEKPRLTETTAFGAAGMAGIGIKFWNEEMFHQLNPVETQFQPHLTPEKQNALYQNWKRAVERSLMWSKT